MQVKSLKKSKKNTYLVILDDNREFLVYDDIIVKYHLLPKVFLEEKVFLDILKENKEKEMYYKALDYLKRRRRTKKELAEYLFKESVSRGQITKIVEELEKEGYLNEEDYVRAFLNDQYRFSADGPYKLKKKLLHLGILEESIDRIFLEISQDLWISKLKKLYEKKVNMKHHEGNYKWREKCDYYFYNLGYPKEWISEVSRDISFGDDRVILERELEKLKRKLERKYLGENLHIQIKKRLYAKGFDRELIEEFLNDKN